MKIQEMYDVSRRLKNDMTLYPGDMEFELNVSNDYEDGYLNSNICMSVHTGTHVDAPAHVNKHGKQIDEVDLHHFVGGATLIEVKNTEAITLKDLEGVELHKDDIILFKTINSDLSLKDSFEEEFVYISDDVCNLLVEKGVKTVGIDYLSIDKYNENTAHDILLNNGICLIEGLCFKNIIEGDDYYISALPLKIDNCEASPVRAVLFKIKM